MRFSESGPIHPFSLHVSHSSPFQVEQSPLARMKNAKTRVLQKVLPRVNHDNNITIGVEDIFIAALVSLSRRQRFCMRHSSQTTDSQKLLRPTFLIPYHHPWP